MARVLEMTFATELGKSKTLRVIDAKDPLTGLRLPLVWITSLPKTFSPVPAEILPAN